MVIIGVAHFAGGPHLGRDSIRIAKSIDGPLSATKGLTERMNDDVSLQAVAEDLEYLRDGWPTDMTVSEVRRGSATLRRLLVDGGSAQVLLGAWRAVGFDGQPSVQAQDLLAQIHSPLGTVDWATSGGVSVPGSEHLVGRVVVYNTGQAGPHGEPTVHPRVDYTPWPEVSLQQYVEAPCSVISGETIKRREMLKYVANYLGGVHLARGRKVHARDRDMIRRIEAWLDRIEIKGFGKVGAYVEVLAMGQALARSKDIAKLVVAIRGRGRA